MGLSMMFEPFINQRPICVMARATLERLLDAGWERVNNDVSGYCLCLEIRQTYDGMLVAIPAPHWKVFGAMSMPEFAAFLRDVAGRVTLSRYKNILAAPRNQRQRKQRQRKRSTKDGGHVSTAKLIATRKPC